jgi:limonene-1,2-epoxide hydrolase
MTEAEEFLQRYTKAMKDNDLDTLVSSWYPDVETTHMLHPDRSWRGTDLYRRVMGQIFQSSAERHVEVRSTAVSENNVFIESVTRQGDGTEVPCVSIFEIEDGQVRRARVYTDVPSRDGVRMEQFVEQMNPGPGPIASPSGGPTPSGGSVSFARE